MDDDLDQLIDDLVDDQPESAESDEDASAADADLADGQDEAEAADDDAEEADDGDDAAEPDDEVSQLRKRLEAVEAERAQQQAQQAAYAQQMAAAQREAQVAQSEQQWDAYFASLEEQAWADAEQTFNPKEAYRVAMAQIIQARDAKKAEFANYRAGQYKQAFERAQVPAYVQYLAGDLKLDAIDLAQLQKMAAKGKHPDDIRDFAISLRERADLQTQQRRAEKNATLKKTSGKPGGGAPRRKRVETLDDLVDQLWG